MKHSYEEIRSAAIDLISGRENATYDLNQYNSLEIGVGEVFFRRERNSGINNQSLNNEDKDIFLEVFWDFFRQGIITLGLNSSNNNFPFFRVSQLGKKILENQQAYFFHDVSSYEKIIKENLPKIDETTLIYLKEAMQAFQSGCILSSSVMLGVSIENIFLKLLTSLENNTKYKGIYKNVFEQKTILQKVNKFKNILDQNIQELESSVKEDLDTNFASILSLIRNFRNDSGHPSGKIIGREQTFVLLQLFIPCAKKIFQLIKHFK